MPEGPTQQGFLLPNLTGALVADYFQRHFGFRPSLGANSMLLLGPALQGVAKRFPHQAAEAQGWGFLASDLKTWPQVLPWLVQHTQGQTWLEQALRPPQARFRVQGLDWQAGDPRVMGILNLTPDSFYDGGRYQEPLAWQTQAKKLVAEGVAILDLGAESTRPGAKPVSAEEQWQRIEPVLRWIRQELGVPVSVDTRLVAVAAKALAAGAQVINDVSGLSAGKEMIELVARHQAGYVLMHSQGTPETMQQAPHYGNALQEVLEFLQKGRDRCLAWGLTQEQIVLDPGIGFGKALVHNLDLLRFGSAFTQLGSLVMLGSSNKSLFGQALGLAPEARQPASLATQVLGLPQGVSLFRVHEVAPVAQALAMTKLYL